MNPVPSITPMPTPAGPASCLAPSATVSAPSQTRGITTALVAALLSLTAVPASAQDALPAAADTTSPAAQPQNTPSRLISPEQMAAHLQAMTAMLAMRTRATDPFGQYQDPNARPIIKSPIAKSTRRVAPVQTVSFPDIIKRITINTVMPKERQFLIGTRLFRQGDRMNLTFRMKNIPVQIVDVTSNRIDFRNMDSGETASLSINLLPAGMSAGSDGISAPGMVRDQPNAPIELDSASASDELSQTR